MSCQLAPVSLVRFAATGCVIEDEVGFDVISHTPLPSVAFPFTVRVVETFLL